MSYSRSRRRQRDLTVRAMTSAADLKASKAQANVRSIAVAQIGSPYAESMTCWKLS